MRWARLGETIHRALSAAHILTQVDRKCPDSVTIAPWRNENGMPSVDFL